MIALYLDSSAMVKLYVPESGSIQTRTAVDRADWCATSSLARVEVLGAVARAVRGARLATADAALIRQQALEDLEAMTAVHVTEELVHQAATLAQRHYLRAYDAVHLASALFLASQVDHEVRFLAFDQNLQSAAHHERLTVVDGKRFFAMTLAPEQLDLPRTLRTRVLRRLKEAGITDLADASVTQMRILKLPGMGILSLRAVVTAARAKGVEIPLGSVRDSRE